MPYGEHRLVWEFHLISCFPGQLRWGPIAVRHRPERFVCQFGYVQSIPPQPIDSWESFDEIDDRWMHYSDHFASAGEMCVVPGQCAADYMNWFFVISHPFKTTAQPSDPPRDPPAMHDASFVEPHIPQVLEPVATSTHARSEVDEPIHAVVSVTICLVVSNVIYFISYY